MVRRTFYPTRATFAEPQARTELLWGYTLRDLDRAARSAVVADRSLAMDSHTRYDIAYSAITEHLCSTDTAPHRQDLVRIGWQAIYTEVRDSYRSKGYRDDGSMAPRFAAYWVQRVVPSPESAIVERLALPQVLAPLGDCYRDALEALAALNDYRAAADHLGINYDALVARLRTGRRTVLALWHEGETPVKTRRTDRRVEAYGKPPATHCGNGHEWTNENTRWYQQTINGRFKRRRFCRACESDRTARRKAAA